MAVSWLSDTRLWERLQQEMVDWGVSVAEGGLLAGSSFAS